MIEDRYWGVLFNAMPIPTLLLKADHPVYTIVFANDAYVAFSNSEQEKIVGASFEAMLRAHYRNAEEILPSLHQILNDKTEQKQSAVKYEFRRPKADGTEAKYIDIINTPMLGPDGEVEYILRTINDVTDLIETQQNEKAIHEYLVKNEKLLRESQRIALIGNWEVDMISQTVTWSNALREIYEVPMDYQPTFESSMIFYKDDKNRNILISVVNDAIEKNSLFDVELEIITATGNERWIRCMGKAELKDDNNVRLYGVTQDITTSKTAETALIDSRNQYQALIESVEGVVWEADAQTFAFSYISSKINDILGYTPEQWLSTPNFWAEHIHKDDRDWAVSYCQQQTWDVANHVFDYRMIKADGGIVWIKDLVSVIAADGKPKLLRGVMIDVTESKLMAGLDNLEKTVLELAADKEEDLRSLLTVYMKGIENLFPHMRCSLLQVKNNIVHTWAAPSMPEEYINLINGQSIGPRAGSCGTSAYRKERVIVTDIANDPLWADYKDFALKHNFRACWSSPIINSDGEVMAAFGMYYDEVKTPDDWEMSVIKRCSSILTVILENRRRAKIIEETSVLMSQGQELANFGNWQWDIRNNVVIWSDVLYDIYGVSKKTHIATYDSYMAMLHDDDREMVKNNLYNALQTREDTMFEERIIRPDGEMRYLKSWGRVICDESGNPEKMIGSCLDITAAKIAESQLWEVAWMQSHLVRAPLARLMGLIDLLKEEQPDSSASRGLLDHVMNTAFEMDKVIRDISSKTLNEA